MAATSKELEIILDDRDDQSYSFAFVVNVQRLMGGEEFVLVPGHTLRRATAKEIEMIKRTLGIRSRGVFGLRYSPWEHVWRDCGDSKELVPLDETEWRYFVISFQGTNATLVEIESALCLSDAGLRIGFVAGASPYAHNLRYSDGSLVVRDLDHLYPKTSYHLGRLFQYLHKPPYDLIRSFDFTPADATQVSILASQIRLQNQRDSDLSRIVGQLLELEELPLGSSSRFLALFGILEALLTHRPKPTDPYDSITRQVKKKLALLDNRWTTRLDYGPFGTAKPDKIWTEMYAYRSLIAHGDAPDFQSGESRLLVSPDAAMLLLKSAVKYVVRMALAEPQLISDLKDC